MQVIIDEVVSSVRAVDGESILAPQTMASIVRTVMKALQAEESHGRRLEEEQTLNNYQRYRDGQRR
ncbi:MAG: hypothetical protein ACU826_01530 [Gammaproteobacteria bacterium]